MGEKNLLSDTKQWNGNLPRYSYSQGKTHLMVWFEIRTWVFPQEANIDPDVHCWYLRTTEDMNFEGKKIATLCTGIILLQNIWNRGQGSILEVFVPSVSNFCTLIEGVLKEFIKSQNFALKLCPQLIIQCIIYKTQWILWS